MRVIELKTAKKIELWPGRKLCVETADGVSIFHLPKGVMTRYRTTLSFGAIIKTSVNIHGTMEQIDKIAEAILAQERPAEGWRVIK